MIIFYIVDVSFDHKENGKTEIEVCKRTGDFDFLSGHNIVTRRVDFFVGDKIMTELKAVAHLDDTNLAQAINYLEAYNLLVGLLLILEVRNWNLKELITPNFRIMEGM